MNSIQEQSQQIERMLYRGKILINEARRVLGKPPLYDLAAERMEAAYGPFIR
ncbi:hypothetical protein [Paenibacillus sp. IHBB 3054]|uniref:hypothetical protein n=1 Tax=Paenibacillus sp. IHBB 3054 TaxID=3425689 RepID=UPI003F66C444